MIISTLEDVVFELQDRQKQLRVEGDPANEGRAIAIAITHIETAILWLKK